MTGLGGVTVTGLGGVTVVGLAGVKVPCLATVKLPIGPGFTWAALTRFDLVLRNLGCEYGPSGKRTNGQRHYQ